MPAAAPRRPLARGTSASGLPPALGYLAFQAHRGPRLARRNSREPFGRMTIAETSSSAVTVPNGLRGQRGPLPHHVPLAPDGQIFSAPPDFPDADLEPPRVDDHHWDSLALAAQHRPMPENSFPRRLPAPPLGVVQCVPEAPRVGVAPIAAARDHRIRDLTCVLHRTARSLPRPVSRFSRPYTLALTMPELAIFPE